MVDLVVELVVEVEKGSSVTERQLIYKILPRSVWQHVVEEGVFHGAGIDLQDGYIHFSSEQQVRETAEKHFAGQSELVLFWVEAGALGPELKWEPSRGGALFPHLYRSLSVTEIVDQKPLTLLEDGTFMFPEWVE